LKSLEVFFFVWEVVFLVFSAKSVIWGGPLHGGGGGGLPAM